MKVAHLSDLHLCKNFKKYNLIKTKKAINLLLEEGFDHLVITGDISDNANPDDFFYLRNLLIKYKLLDPEKTSIVIGNHDIFGGVQTAADIINFPSKCKNIDYNEKIDIFTTYFEELFTGSFFPLPGNFFPFAKKIGNMLIIGLNSIDVYSSLKNPFASNGKIKKDEFAALNEIFNKPQFKDLLKIVLTHHHFYKNSIAATSSNQLWNRLENFTLKMRGKKKLLKLFKQNDVKTVFHGHCHEVKEYFRKGIQFLNAGSGIDNEIKDKIYLSLTEYNDYEPATRFLSFNIVQNHYSGGKDSHVLQTALNRKEKVF